MGVKMRNQDKYQFIFLFILRRRGLPKRKSGELVKKRTHSKK